MRTTHEAKLRLCIGIFPDYGIVIVYALQFRIVDHVYVRIFRDEAFALFLSFGGQTVDVIETDRTVGGGCRTEVLEIGASSVVKLIAEPFVKTLDVRNEKRIFKNKTFSNLVLTLFFDPTVDT